MSLSKVLFMPQISSLSVIRYFICDLVLKHNGSFAPSGTFFQLLRTFEKLEAREKDLRGGGLVSVKTNGW